MKRVSQIYQQYKQVKFRTRKKLVNAMLQVEPCKCAYQSQIPLSTMPDPKVVLCEYAGLEGDPQWETVVCDEDVARACPMFLPLDLPSGTKATFDKFLAYAERTGEIGTLAYHYPDLAALLWVLEPWRSSLCAECATGECNCERAVLDLSGVGDTGISLLSVCSDSVLDVDPLSLVDFEEGDSEESSEEAAEEEAVEDTEVGQDFVEPLEFTLPEPIQNLLGTPGFFIMLLVGLVTLAVGAGLLLSLL